ncbi:MAG: SRPBCC domain-containing protein [Sphingomonadaceae bacterium]|nr:SRPBCC domain-containing protein [Sphingomonadaceae bacterium]
MKSVTLVREIRAGPSTVFDLLSTAEGLTAWWGPDQLPVLSAEADVRVGGSFRVRFGAVDGSEHECAGEFIEVDPPERIVMSWRWTQGGVAEEQGATSRVELQVRPRGRGATLTLIHEGLRNAASVASHRQGWNGAVEKLSSRLSRLPQRLCQNGSVTVDDRVSM